MAWLVDTSLLVRLANTADSSYSTAVHAIKTLHRRGEVIHTTPQNYLEFRSVATRPILVNGLGLDPFDAEFKADSFEVLFPPLVETPDNYLAWKNLVKKSEIIGKQVHDARLVAVCQVYGITHLLTFNSGHFTRLATHVPGLVIVDPSNL